LGLVRFGQTEQLLFLLDKMGYEERKDYQQEGYIDKGSHIKS
jgi:hypothetical protein